VRATATTYRSWRISIPTTVKYPNSPDKQRNLPATTEAPSARLQRRGVEIRDFVSLICLIANAKQIQGVIDGYIARCDSAN
jgi:hypothetical protein